MHASTHPCNINCRKVIEARLPDACRRLFAFAWKTTKNKSTTAALKTRRQKHSSTAIVATSSRRAMQQGIKNKSPLHSNAPRKHSSTEKHSTTATAANSRRRETNQTSRVRLCPRASVDIGFVEIGQSVRYSSRNQCYWPPTLYTTDRHTI